MPDKVKLTIRMDRVVSEHLNEFLKAQKITATAWAQTLAEATIELWRDESEGGEPIVADERIRKLVERARAIDRERRARSHLGRTTCATLTLSLTLVTAALMFRLGTRRS